jgi:hypothetical protein
MKKPANSITIRARTAIAMIAPLEIVDPLELNIHWLGLLGLGFSGEQDSRNLP